MKLPAGLKGLLGDLGVTIADEKAPALPVQPPARNATVDTLNVLLKGTNLKVKELEVVPGDNDFLPGRTLVIDTSQCLVAGNREQAARFGMGHLTTIRERCGLMSTNIELDGRNITSTEMKITLPREGFNDMRETPQYKAALAQVSAPKRQLA